MICCATFEKLFEQKDHQQIDSRVHPLGQSLLKFKLEMELLIQTKKTIRF